MDVETKTGKSWTIFLIVGLLVFGVWLAVWWLVPYYYEGDFSKSGQSGDMFGSVNALFSGLAFAGLISTLIMQRSELELQRRELELSRQEFALQRFENTLFGLIKQLNDHVASLDRSYSSRSQGEIVYVTKRGREVIKDIASELPDQLYTERQFVFTTNSKPPEKKQRTLQQQHDEFRDQFDKSYEPDFAPYMRVLYGIFRHIDLAGIPEDRKKMYSRIARANLSSAEIKFIMFDCCSGVGVDFRNWIEKYGLLKHLPKIDREANPDMVKLYAPSAFEPIAIPHSPM